MKTSFTAAGAQWKREVFSSAPRNVIVVRIECTRPFALDRPPRSPCAQRDHCRIGDDRLVMTGAARPVKPTTDPATQERQVGVAFRAELKAIPEGGTVRAAGNTLRIENARAVTLLLTAATDFREHDAAGMAAACARNLRSAAGTLLRRTARASTSPTIAVTQAAPIFVLLDGPDPLRDRRHRQAHGAHARMAAKIRGPHRHLFSVSAATCSSAAAARALCRPTCRASGTRASIRRGDRSTPSTSTPR